MQFRASVEVQGQLMWRLDAGPAARCRPLLPATANRHAARRPSPPQECAALERHGVAVRVVGDLSLAPPAVRAAAARIEDATRHHGRAVLNLCFSYT